MYTYMILFDTGQDILTSYEKFDKIHMKCLTNNTTILLIPALGVCYQLVTCIGFYTSVAVQR